MDLMMFGQVNSFCCFIGEYLQIHSVQENTFCFVFPRFHFIDKSCIAHTLTKYNIDKMSHSYNNQFVM